MSNLLKHTGSHALPWEWTHLDTQVQEPFAEWEAWLKKVATCRHKGRKRRAFGANRDNTWAAQSSRTVPGAPIRFSVFVSNRAFNRLPLAAPMARDGVFASMYIKEKLTMLPTCMCQSLCAWPRMLARRLRIEQQRCANSRASDHGAAAKSTHHDSREDKVKLV